MAKPNITITQVGFTVAQTPAEPNIFQVRDDLKNIEQDRADIFTTFQEVCLCVKEQSGAKISKI